MLNKTIRVKITKPYGCPCPEKASSYKLNFGRGTVLTDKGIVETDAYIIGITHPVKKFEGKIIAVIKRSNNTTCVVAANKNTRYVNCDIIPLIEPIEKRGTYHLDCLYENSCGAIVYRYINGLPRFLLIKNKRSSHWGFPKGHMELGETQLDTARREVLEETGINIDIIEDFCCTSDYRIGGKVEKSVAIFLATTKDTQTIIQHEEIEDYIWLNYSQALNILNFENDKNILIKANDYMNNVLGVKTDGSNN